MSNFLSDTDLLEIGFKNIGKNVFISKKASIYSPQNISLGNNVRIDDFCVLSGKITIGNYVHIAVFCALFGGQAGITVYDFANFSSRISVYALNDDYSGETMTNPMIPDEFKNVEQKEVTIGRHVIIGSGSVVLPGTMIHEGGAFGALSLIRGEIEPWTINAGIPCKKIKERSKNLLILENRFWGGIDIDFKI